LRTLNGIFGVPLLHVKLCCEIAGGVAMPPSSPRETREDDENAIPLMVHSKNIASDVRSHHRVATTHHNETAGDTPSRPQNNSSPAPGLLRKWWTEFVCCVLVMGALLAIVATVYPYSGSPLPQWPYGLSINTLIAIYVTTLKAAMLFVVAQGRASP